MLAEKTIRLNRSSRRVLLTAMGIISAVGLYRWILAPYTGQLFAAQQYESTLDEAIHKTNLLDTMIKTKKAKTEELTRKCYDLRNLLFTPEEVREFFASLPKVGHQNGCLIQSISSLSGEQNTSQNQPGDNSGIICIKAAATVIGRYNGIIGFLNNLQDSQHKVWIESMRINTIGSPGKLKCQVVLTLYYVENMEIVPL
jgi:hypothetical protein